MSDPFLSSDDYAERAHQLYNQGLYELAIAELRAGITSYPNAPELHVGLAYAQLAVEEYAWAREGFERALALDPNNEEGLAGLGESLLKLGERGQALQCFDRVLSLGFREDHDLMLQVGRALFRESMLRHARGFFEIAVEFHAASSEAAACLGYAAHRLGDEDAALYWLRRALDLDETHAEARVYLGNLLYDRGEYEACLFHVEDHRAQEVHLPAPQRRPRACAMAAASGRAGQRAGPGGSVACRDRRHPARRHDPRSPPAGAFRHAVAGAPGHAAPPPDGSPGEDHFRGDLCRHLGRDRLPDEERSGVASKRA